MMMMTMTRMGLVSKAQILMIIAQVILLATAKPTGKPVEQKSNSQPVYEQQLTVWPTDIDDIVDVLQESVPIGTIVPIVEDPVVVMPVFDDEFEDQENLDDDTDSGSSIVDEVVNDEPEVVHVLENYHTTYGNGTKEIKLTLSNGMVNYQRIDYKNIDGKLRPVQDGYYTVPFASNPESYQTIYYHADEDGYNVYKTEVSARNPAFDYYLQYVKDQLV